MKFENISIVILTLAVIVCLLIVCDTVKIFISLNSPRKIKLRIKQYTVKTISITIFFLNFILKHIFTLNCEVKFEHDHFYEYIKMNPDVEIQYDLYLAAYLVDFKKNVLIPDYWSDTFDLAKAINYGLNSNENHLIFVSPDLNKVPDFSLPVRNFLDLKTDGCYFGKVIRSFSK